MSNHYSTVKALAASYDEGDARFWPNDTGPTLTGTVAASDDPHYEPIVVKGFVGLVDEADGGMIAYGKPEVIERLADDLNRLHVIESVVKA